MKKKVLLSSIATILLCLCLIAGSTFALFTDKSEFDISVTSGTVDVEASVVDIQHYSAEKVAGTNKTAEMTDENNKGYYYLGTGNKFTNGGFGEYANGELTISNITPGDKLTFKIEASNSSNVAILYRVKITCTSGTKLVEALDIKFTNASDNSTIFATKGLESYVSEWIPTSVNGEDIPDILVEIELPIKTGNTYQNLTSEFTVTLEAVQGNADVDDESELETVVNP